MYNQPMSSYVNISFTTYIMIKAFIKKTIIRFYINDDVDVNRFLHVNTYFRHDCSYEKYLKKNASSTLSQRTVKTIYNIR